MSHATYRTHPPTIPSHSTTHRYYFNNFTQPALLYCLLHSIYCSCWLTKHMTFRCVL